MPAQPSVNHILRFAFEFSKKILFPFRKGRWFRLLVIVWLGGQAMTVSTSDFRKPLEKAAGEGEIAAQGVPSGETGAVISAGEEEPAEPAADIEKATPEEKRQVRTALALAVPIGLAAGLVWLWVIACFKFVFMDFMILHDISIRKSFARFRRHGFSYFWWVIRLTVLVFAIPAVYLLFFLNLRGKITLFPVEGLRVLLEPFGSWVPWCHSAMLFFTAFLLLAYFVALVLLDFIVPIMYQDNISMGRAWNVFMGARIRAGELVRYFLIKFGLLLVAVLFSSVVTAVVALITAVLVFLFVKLIGVWLAGIFPFLKPVILLAARLLFTTGGTILLVLVAFILLPVPVVYRAFALSYLARLLPAYNVLGVPPETEGAGSCESRMDL